MSTSVAAFARGESDDDEDSPALWLSEADGGGADPGSERRSGDGSCVLLGAPFVGVVLSLEDEEEDDEDRDGALSSEGGGDGSLSFLFPLL